MALRRVEYYAGSDQLLTIAIENIDLADGVSTKTVTANIVTQTDPTTTTALSSGITVTATGTASSITIQPDATLKALGKGMYDIVFIATDGSSNVEYTDPMPLIIHSIAGVY